MNPKDIKKRLGQNILRLRKDYGLSRKALARLSHISTDRLRQVEHGDSSAKLYDYHLKRLGEIFYICVDELFEEK